MSVRLNHVAQRVIVSNQLLMHTHGRIFLNIKFSFKKVLYSSVCGIGYTGTNCNIQINYCSPNPCVYGTCSSSISTYVCTCNTGYQGKNCDVQINSCLLNNCANGGTCVVTGPGTYQCNCAPGYNGTNCQTMINYCYSNLLKCLYLLLPSWLHWSKLCFNNKFMQCSTMLKRWYLPAVGESIKLPMYMPNGLCWFQLSNNYK